MRSLYVLAFLFYAYSSFAQSIAWTQLLQGEGSQYPNSIYADPDGNLYAGGRFENTMFAFGQSITSMDANDGYGLKINRDGQLEWLKTFGEQGDDVLQRINPGKDGRLFLSSSYSRIFDWADNLQIVIGDGTYRQGIFSRISPEGEQLGFSIQGSDGELIPDAYLEGSDGSTYAGLRFAEDYSFMDVELLNTGGAADILFLRFLPQGGIDWFLQLFTITDATLNKVILDGEDNLYAAVTFTASILIDGNNIASSSGEDAVLLKIRPDGSLAWVKRIGGFSNTRLRSIALDPAGNVFLTGVAHFTLEYDGEEYSTGSNDIYLMKVNPEGELIRFHTFGGTGYDEGIALSVGPAGGVVIGGIFENGFDLAPGLPVSEEVIEGNEGFVAKFDAEGNARWVFSVTGTDLDWINRVAHADNGDVFAAGPFRGSAQIGATITESMGEWDAFFSRIDCPVAEPVIEQNNDELSVSGAYEQYVWYYEGEVIPSAQGALLPVTEAGTYQVAVAAENGCERISDTFAYLINAVEDREAATLNIFPNPAGEFTTIRLPENWPSVSQLLIWDARGRLLMTESASAQNAQLVVNLKGLPSGMLMIELRSEQGRLRGRVMH